MGRWMADRDMDLLEKRITQNLFEVRNTFAEEPSDDPDAAFGLLFDISDIKPEHRKTVQAFCKLGEELVDIRLDREIAQWRDAQGDFLERYAALEARVSGAMRIHGFEAQ